MELNKIGNFKIIKVVQTSHHQTDARYDVSRGIQCSCISLMPISGLHSSYHTFGS